MSAAGARRTCDKVTLPDFIKNRINPTRHNASANARRKSFETVALVRGLNIFRDGSGGLGGRAMKIGRRPQQLGRLSEALFSPLTVCSQTLCTTDPDFRVGSENGTKVGEKVNMANGTLSPCIIFEQKLERKNIFAESE